MRHPKERPLYGEGWRESRARHAVYQYVVLDLQASAVSTRVCA